MLAGTVRPEGAFITAFVGEPCVSPEVTFVVLLFLRLAAIGAGEDFFSVLGELF